MNTTIQHDYQYKVTGVAAGMNDEALRAQQEAHAQAEGRDGWELIIVNFYPGASLSIWYWKRLAR